MYFSVGWRESANARFQLSFRYRFVGADGGAAGDALAAHLYFGYTQTSLWDIGSESAPFRDTSYRPSLFFFRSDLGRHWLGARRCGIQAGLEHESNGRSAEASRSVNTVFVRPLLAWGETRGYVWTLAPKFWLYVGDLSDNPDIADYRGWAEVLLKVEKQDSWGFSVIGRKGSRRAYGSIEIHASYPLDRLFSGRFDSYLHVQYFAGWGESLLDYDRKRASQVRIGLMLVR
ncbi:MAG: phospholipase A [Acidobacteriota bacterium]|nr:phospholipase A [Acidobacteriota bacterium]